MSHLSVNIYRLVINAATNLAELSVVVWELNNVLVDYYFFKFVNNYLMKGKLVLAAEFAFKAQFQCSI